MPRLAQTPGLPGLVLVLGICGASATAQAGESFLGQDKAAHALISGAMAGTCYAALTLLSDDGRPVRATLSIGLALVPGLLKEVYDAGQPQNRFSSADLAWDAIGVLAGVGLALSVDLLVERVRSGPRSGLSLALTGPGVALMGRF